MRKEQQLWREDPGGSHGSAFKAKVALEAMEEQQSLVELAGVLDSTNNLTMSEFSCTMNVNLK
ncbi:MAG: hypothetical protein ACP5LD_15590 [Desulfomonilaceae bacterium]